MNETQPEPPRPDNDYDFILQQAEPAVKKGSSKKVLAILFMLPLAVVVLAASLLLGGSNQDTESPSTDSSGNSTNETVAQQFITAMKADEDEYQSLAYALLGDNLKTDPALATNSLIRIRESIDFTSCKLGRVATEDNKQLTNYNCENLQGRDISIQIVANDKVTAYRVN